MEMWMTTKEIYWVSFMNGLVNSSKSQTYSDTISIHKVFLFMCHSLFYAFVLLFFGLHHFVDKCYGFCVCKYQWIVLFSVLNGYVFVLSAPCGCIWWSVSECRVDLECIIQKLEEKNLRKHSFQHVISVTVNWSSNVDILIATCRSRLMQTEQKLFNVNSIDYWLQISNYPLTIDFDWNIEPFDVVNKLPISSCIWWCKSFACHIIRSTKL